MNIGVVTINACLAVPPPLRFNGAFARGARFADALYNNINDLASIDIICLQELIVNRNQILKSLYLHPYSTKIDYGSIFGDNIRFLQSGLTIASKWPIVEQKNHIFSGPTYHFEALMAKSVQYAKIKTQDNFIHVFNTHTQAWANLKAKNIRLNQFKQIGQFIKSLHIPKNEVVILCGDCNFDFYEHSRMLTEIMSIIDFTMHLPPNPQFSFDPTVNQLVGTDDASEYTTQFDTNGCYEEFLKSGICNCCPRQLIDGIASSNKHLKPLNVKTCVIQNTASKPFEIYINISTKRMTKNISDHFAVLTHFEFPLKQELAALKTEEVYSQDANLGYWGWVILEIVFFVLFYFICIMILIAIYKRKKNHKEE